MKQGILLEVAKRNPSKRISRHAWVKEMKRDYGIWTHNAPGAGNWMALCVPECLSELAGCNLTEEEMREPIAMLAGYVRLLDEAGLVEEGHKTEHEAVQAQVDRIERCDT